MKPEFTLALIEHARAEELNALTHIFVLQTPCSRCGHEAQKPATIYKYGALWCSDECAERAGDFACEDGAEVLADTNFAESLDAQAAVFTPILQEAEAVVKIEFSDGQWSCIIASAPWGQGGVVVKDKTEALARLRACLSLFQRQLYRRSGGHPNETKEAI